MGALFTKDLADTVIQQVMPAILGMMQDGVTKRKQIHIVVAHPDVHPLREGMQREGWLAREILTEFSIGRSDWEYPYEEYARKKAFATWRTRRTTRELVTTHQHLLEPGDISYYGSVIIDDNIVVGCSGVEPYFDELFSYWIGYGIRARCNHAFALNAVGKDPYVV